MKLKISATLLQMGEWEREIEVSPYWHRQGEARHLDFIQRTILQNIVRNIHWEEIIKERKK